MSASKFYRFGAFLHRACLKYGGFSWHVSVSNLANDYKWSASNGPRKSKALSSYGTWDRCNSGWMTLQVAETSFYTFFNPSQLVPSCTPSIFKLQTSANAKVCKHIQRSCGFIWRNMASPCALMVPIHRGSCPTQGEAHEAQLTALPRNSHSRNRHILSLI